MRGAYPHIAQNSHFILLKTQIHLVTAILFRYNPFLHQKMADDLLRGYGIAGGYVIYNLISAYRFR